MSDSRDLLTLSDYASMLRRRWWLPALGLVIGAVLGVIASGRGEPTYFAEARVLSAGSSLAALPGDVSAAAGATATAIELVKSDAVAEEASRILGLDGAAPVVDPQGVGASDVISIGVNWSDGTQAAEIANAYAQAFVTVRSAQLTAAVATYSADSSNRLAKLDSDGSSESLLAQEHAAIAGELARLEAQASVIGSRIAVINAAKPATTPTGSSGRDAGLAGFVGLVAGLVLMVGLELARQHADD